MDNQIFRKKSMDKIASPEQLTDYIRVSNPGVWMLLAAIVLLLAGVCVWGVLGRMDTKLPVAAVSRGGVAVCYVREADISTVKTGMTVRCGEGEYQISGISSAPVAVDDAVDEYVRHVGSLQLGEWVYIATFDRDGPDGVFEADIITDSVSPLSFVLN